MMPIIIYTTSHLFCVQCLLILPSGQFDRALVPINIAQWTSLLCRRAAVV